MKNTLKRINEASLRRLIERKVNEILNEELENGTNSYYAQAYRWLGEYLSNNVDQIVSEYEQSSKTGGSRGMDMMKIINTVSQELEQKANGLSQEGLN